MHKLGVIKAIARAWKVAMGISMPMAVLMSMYHTVLSLHEVVSMILVHI